MNGDENTTRDRGESGASDRPRKQQPLDDGEATDAAAEAASGVVDPSSKRAQEAFEERLERNKSSTGAASTMAGGKELVAGKASADPSRKGDDARESFESRLQRKSANGGSAQDGSSSLAAPPPAVPAKLSAGGQTRAAEAETFEERISRKSARESAGAALPNGTSRNAVATFEERLKRKSDGHSSMAGVKVGNAADPSKNARRSFDERLMRKAAEGSAQDGSTPATPPPAVPAKLSVGGQTRAAEAETFEERMSRKSAGAALPNGTSRNAGDAFEERLKRKSNGHSSMAREELVEKSADPSKNARRSFDERLMRKAAEGSARDGSSLAAPPPAVPAKLSAKGQTRVAEAETFEERIGRKSAPAALPNGSSGNVVATFEERLKRKSAAGGSSGPGSSPPTSLPADSATRNEGSTSAKPGVVSAEERVRRFDERIHDKMMQRQQGRPGKAGGDGDRGTRPADGGKKTFERLLDEKIRKASEGPADATAAAPTESTKSATSKSTGVDDAASSLDDGFDRKMQQDTRRGRGDGAAANRQCETFGDRVNRKVREGCYADPPTQPNELPPPLPSPVQRDDSWGEGKKPVAIGAEDRLGDVGPPPLDRRMAIELDETRESELVVGRSESFVDDNTEVAVAEGPSDRATDRSLAAAAPPPLQADDGSPKFYAVEARLVGEEDDEERPQAPVYDATIVTDQSSLPWWKRTRIRAGAILVVAVATAATIGAVVAGSRGGGPGPDDSDPPTSSPTYSPPPFECAVDNLGPFFEDECEWCLHALALDGGGTTAVSTDDADGMGIKGIHFASSKNPPDDDDASDGSSYDYYYATEYDIGAMAVSGDVVAAGSPYEGDSWIGAVYVIEKDSSSGIWNQTAHVVPADVDDGAEFGASVSVGGDLIVVGAPNDRETIGSAFIYRRTETGWEEEVKLAPKDSNMQNFGHRSAINGDVVAIADNLYGDDGQGAVLVYQRDNSSQWLLKHNITNDECTGRFGNSFAFSGGNNMVIGCPLADGNIGAVYYYTYSVEEDDYSLRQKITSQEEEATADEFGGELAADGKFMIAGTFEMVNGKAFVFTLDEDDIWKKVARIDVPSSNHTYFGMAIELSGDDVLVSYWGNVYSYKLLCSEPE